MYDLNADGTESRRSPAGGGHSRGVDQATPRPHARDVDTQASGPRLNGPQPNGPQPNDPQLNDPRVNDLFGVLYRRRWWIGAVMALAALAGYGLGWRSSVENWSETRLALVGGSEESVLSPAPTPAPLEERQSAAVARAQSDRTRAQVTEALRLEPDDIKDVSAKAEEGESFITITVTTVEGVDTAAITDQVAASVIAQQQDAVRERSDALAGELRRAAAEIDGEIVAVDARLEGLSWEIALLQLDVAARTGTIAGVDSSVALTLRTDMASGLRGTRAALLATQSDFERRAKEADVAAAIRTGGLEVYEPAGAVQTTRTLPMGQFAVLLASIGLVVMVGAAYFTAYRGASSPNPAPIIDPGWNGRTGVPNRRPQDDDERGDAGDPAVHAERTSRA